MRPGLEKKGEMQRARVRFKSRTPLEPGTACANDTYYPAIVPNHRDEVAYNIAAAGKHLRSPLAFVAGYYRNIPCRASI
jgi:hypothetical protein